MPLNPSQRKRSYTRTRACAALLAALAVFAAAALFGVGASAQRAKNDNAQQQGRSSRRVIVGRGSDTPNGSRTTITADDSLNDYSAYRSGDRFYVVLPKSAAGAVSKGSGKGYTDVQVQQRGDSVVVSYKVQPGAKPRVEQKFNRLDVVFDVKEGGGQQAASSGQESASQQQQPNENRNASAQQQQQQQQATAQPKPTAEAPNERRPNEAAINAAQQGAANQSNTSAPNGETATQQTEATQPAPAPTGEQPATAAPTTEPQVVQNQPPAQIAPITNPDTSVAGAQAGASFGAMLARNWPIPVFIALALIGLGLVLFTRRSSSQEPIGLDAAAATTTKTKTLEEPRTSGLKEAKAEPVAVADTPAAKPEPLVENKIKPLVAPAPVPSDRKKKKKQRKAKLRGGRADELPLVDSKADETPSLDSSAATAAEVAAAEVAAPSTEETPTAVAETETPTTVVETSVEESSLEAAVPDVEETVVAGPEAVETPVAETEAATVEASALETEAAAAETHEVVSTQPSEVSTPTVEETTTVEETSTPTVEADASQETSTESSAQPSLETEAVETLAVPVAGATAAVVAETLTEPSAESAVEPVAEPVVESAETVTSIAPAGAPDAEDVQTQTRRLLEGESYDRGVIGSEDSMARQLIGAELLSALASRNVERRERARAAFKEHGYFDEKARDVRDAAAPAERAAAARSLAIVGERSAAPHLIAALEDDSMEVRRASVEALGSLRAPEAVEPLEALLRRERLERNKIPSRIIQHAIETCRLAAAEALAPTVEETQAATETQAETQTSVEEARPETHAAVEAQRVVGIEPVEETTHVEEPSHVEEARPVEEVQTEEPSHVEEVSAVGESAFEFETEDAGTPVAESNAVEPLFATPQTFETHAAEPPAAEQSSAVEEVESVEEASREVSSVEEASSVEPTEVSSVEPVEVSDAGSSASFVSSAEPSKAGEWFEFDVNDLRAPEPAQAAVTHEAVFESSSGETMQAEPAAEAETQTHAVETFEDTSAHETFEETHARETLEDSGATETAVEARGVEEAAEVSSPESGRGDATESAVEPLFGAASEAATAPLPSIEEKGVVPFDEHSIVPAAIQQRLTSREASVRAAAITELSRIDTDEAFQQICAGFDDEAKEVRSAAARALYELRADRAESFTRALREAPAERRRSIGSAINTSGLASEAISQLTGESRDKTYEAFSLLFLMAKAGEVQPLVRAIEGHPNNEVRLAVVKLLALSGQKEILPAFRRLAVRGSLPTEVRSAVMEAIYQISSSQPTPA